MEPATAPEDMPHTRAVFRLQLAPDGPVVDAPAHLTVLRAAELAGQPLPSSCRNGSCRTCMQQLRSGSVRWTVDWPGLLAHEKEDGWILPCVACPTSDLVLGGGPVWP